jgi:hypothetical protein
MRATTYLAALAALRRCMNADVELRHDAWIAIIKLAAVVSTAAALFAIGMSLAGDVSQTAIVLPVIVVGFASSWTLTGRLQTVRVQPRRARHSAATALR